MGVLFPLYFVYFLIMVQLPLSTFPGQKPENSFKLLSLCQCLIFIKIHWLFLLHPFAPTLRWFRFSLSLALGCGSNTATDLPLPLLSLRYSPINKSVKLLPEQSFLKYQNIKYHSLFNSFYCSQDKIKLLIMAYNTP